MLKKLTFKLGMKWNSHGANHFAKAEAAEKNHNEAEALAAYELAAKNGHAKAQYRLAQRYFLGLGVKKNHAEAMVWYQKAAEQGDAEAQFSLGVIYRKGRGVAPNPAEAMHWYKKAAEQGLMEAQNNLASLYYYVRNKSSILSKGQALGPSDKAKAGLGWVSIKIPEMPTATAARAKTGTNSR